MTSKLLRWTMLAALVVAVLSGPALALCELGMDSGCCCTDKKRCPKPRTAEAQAAACCQSAPVAPPPLTGSTERGSDSTPQLTTHDTAVVADVTPHPRWGSGVTPRALKSASGIGLYTLHAAFLI